METDGTDSYKLRFDEIRYKVNTNSMSLQLTHFTFYINSELGRGKYGVVHLVKEKGTQKPLAAKCIKTRKRVNILFIFCDPETVLTARQRASRGGDLYPEETQSRENNQIRGKLLQQDRVHHSAGVPRRR